MEKIDDDNNVEESTGKKHLSLKLDGESMEFDLKIDDCRADKFNGETENIKLNAHKEFPSYWDKILEVKLKSLELIENEMDNCTLSTHNVATALIIGLASLSIYLFSNLSNINNTNNTSSIIYTNNISHANGITYIILLGIPFLVCFISVYITDHQRTMIHNSVNAKHMESDINELFKDVPNINQKIIYFESLTSHAYTKDYVQMSINIALIILYITPIIILDSNPLESLYIIHGRLDDANLLYLFPILVWLIVIIPVTRFTIMYEGTIKYYSICLDAIINKHKIDGHDYKSLDKDYKKIDVSDLFKKKYENETTRTIINGVFIIPITLYNASLIIIVASKLV